MKNTTTSELPDELENLRRTQLLVEKVTDYAICMLTPEGMIATWNAGARRFKGYQDAEILGQHFARFYTDEDRAAGLPARALQRARDDGGFEDEGWRVRKDGTRFWASVVIDALRDDQGVLLGFAKITRDISDKKAARDALRASEDQFRILVQGVIDYAIYMLSPDGQITNWNAGAQRIKGFTADEVVGSHFSRFYTPEDQARGEPARALATAREHGRFEAEGWRVRKDGTQFRAHVVIDAIRDESGTLLGFAKVTRDVTQRMQLESTKSALQHSQKLESVGKLTGGVAHDFNNILQVIGGNLQLLGAHIGNQGPALHYLEEALLAVNRGANLSSQLLAFARRQPLQPVVVNPGRILTGSEEMLQRTLGETIRVETVVSGALWHAVLDPHQLENVLLNLAINARDAMPDGGKLTLEAGNAVLDDAYVATLPDIPAGQYVVISVSDTGCGMSKDVLEHAVEPFFTTKTEGRGTGLGLSMAFGFVKQSEGHFRMYSEVGHGTTIRMYFPRSQATEAPLPAPASAEIPHGNETILVVEDDLAVQSVVVEILRNLGYHVLKADNPDAALAVLRAGVSCDLLFTDVVMPGTIKSTQLAQQAKRMLPALKVLFTSGYTQNAIIHGGRLDPGVHLLSKPYRREDLARKVRQLLGEPATPVTPPVAIATLPAAATAPPVAVATPPAATVTPPTPPAPAVVTAAEPAVPAPAGRRVLLVEDEPDALCVTTELLTMLGFVVDAVPSAEAALVLLETQPFDILFTDINLPGMDGLALAYRLRRRQPGLVLIFASGDGRVGGEVRQLGGRFLRKPYALAELQAVLDPAPAKPAS